MKSNQVTAIGVSIIAIGVVAAGSIFGVKEYKNYKWRNNPNTSAFNDINSECLRKKIMNKYHDNNLCLSLELDRRGLSAKEYNEWVDWYNSKRLR